MTGSDRTGTTTYVYEGNTVKTIDPTSRWKKITSDAFGNLVQVNEPNPTTGGADYVTTYTYNNANQLTGVSMPRGAATQTRSFTYDVAGRMLTETHPETGTTTYTWNAAGGPLATKVDAKGQRTAYTYDTVRRMVGEFHYNAANVENLCERVFYAYDGGSQHTYGRLSSVNWGDEKPSVCGAGKLTETYDYDANGRVTSKELRVKQKDLTPVSIPQQIDGEAALLATWTYNANGQMSGTKYPDSNLTGPTYNYGYDTMLRINGMTQGATTLVNDVLYGPAGEMTQWRRNGTLETRAFNERGQLTNIYQDGTLKHEYRYWATQNDGRAIGYKNWTSGEDVSYFYDSLGRLSGAITAGPQWGQNFGYDGFGNLLSKTVTKGSAPALSITVDPATNRINGQAYDANGNMTGFGTFDMKNRLATASGWTYGYDTSNRRVWKKAANGDLYFDYWAPGGEKLGGYKLVYNVFANAPKTIRFDMVTELKYFAGRKLELTDQLGSQVATHPYGEERVVTANDTYKYATYFRDANGLDYAVNRYYSSVYGRFLSPDPVDDSSSPTNSQSWNRYAYVQNNPISLLDPDGLSPVTASACEDAKRMAIAVGGQANFTCPTVTFAITVTASTPGSTWSPAYTHGPGGMPGSAFDVHRPQAPTGPPGGANPGGGGAGLDLEGPPRGAILSPCPPAQQGIGVGVIGGGTAEAGIGSGGGGTIQAGVGTGIFYNGQGGGSAGIFTSGTQPNGNGVSVTGAYIGYAPGIFITNGGSPAQISGVAQAFSMNIGIGLLGLSITYSVDPKTGVFFTTISFGPFPIAGGLGFSVTTAPVNAFAGTLRPPGTPAPCP